MNVNLSGKYIGETKGVPVKSIDGYCLKNMLKKLNYT